jgi:mono/diheme cytochrome c family protein
MGMKGMSLYIDWQWAERVNRAGARVLRHVVPCMVMMSSLSVADVRAGADGSAGQAIYQQHCAMCHDHPQDMIPPKATLGSHPHDYIVHALTAGPMQPQATGLSAAQIDAVASYLIDDAKSHLPAGVRPSVLEEPNPLANLCKGAAPRLSLSTRDWNGFSPDLENTRFQREAWTESGRCLSIET